MPRGYRYVLIAAVGLALVGAGQPDQKDSAKQERPTAQKRADQASPPTIPPIIRTISADKPDAGCPDQKDNPASDLCAQWKAADAAYDAARWGWWQLVAGGMGLLIGGATLAAALMAARYARDAARETKRGADVAEDSLAQTMRIGEAQTRAYISVTKLSGRHFDNGLVFRAVTKNTGQSPAIDARAIFHIVQPDGQIYTEDAGNTCNIGAGTEQDMALWYYREPAARDWSGAVLYVTIVYADVFGSTNTVAETFGGSPDSWNGAEDHELIAGRHLRGYVDTMGDDLEKADHAKN